jgi:hypothetical protein
MRDVLKRIALATLADEQSDDYDGDGDGDAECEGSSS